MTDEKLTDTQVLGFIEMEFKQAAAVVALAIDLAKLENGPHHARFVGTYTGLAIELLHKARKQLDQDPL